MLRPFAERRALLPSGGAADPGVKFAAELVGGAASAAVAAWGWKLLWTHVIDRMTLESRKSR